MVDMGNCSRYRESLAQWCAPEEEVWHRRGAVREGKWWVQVDSLLHTEMDDGLRIAACWRRGHPSPGWVTWVLDDAEWLVEPAPELHPVKGCSMSIELFCLPKSTIMFPWCYIERLQLLHQLVSALTPSRWPRWGSGWAMTLELGLILVHF